MGSTVNWEMCGWGNVYAAVYAIDVAKLPINAFYDSLCGATFLQRAVIHNEVHTVKYLLKRGADPATGTFAGPGVLWHSCFRRVGMPTFLALLDSLTDLDPFLEEVAQKESPLAVLLHQRQNEKLAALLSRPDAHVLFVTPKARLHVKAIATFARQEALTDETRELLGALAWFQRKSSWIAGCVILGSL